MAASQVEETLKRIQTRDGVTSVIIVNSDGPLVFRVGRVNLQFYGRMSRFVSGIPINSTVDNMVSVQYAGLVQQLMGTSRSFIKTDDPSNELDILRIRTKKNEIIIIPGTFQPAALKHVYCFSILFQIWLLNGHYISNINTYTRLKYTGCWSTAYLCFQINCFTNLIQHYLI